jgi:hypothetical protein
LAGLRGGLALAVHQPTDNINEALRDSDIADNLFKLGEVLEQLYALVPIAGTICVVRRARPNSQG